MFGIFFGSCMYFCFEHNDIEEKLSVSNLFLSKDNIKNIVTDGMSFIRQRNMKKNISFFPSSLFQTEKHDVKKVIRSGPEKSFSFPISPCACLRLRVSVSLYHT